uniref:Uncharacterized protein n=1 Tax=Anguilla anguilla TaxID=7936 RepID=A0A0E9PE77_ANGAN
MCFNVCPLKACLDEYVESREIPGVTQLRLAADPRLCEPCEWGGSVV